MTLFDELKQHKIPVFYRAFTALDRYFRRRVAPSVSQPSASRPSAYIVVGCSLVDLARIVEDLEFPAIDDIDAAVTRGDTRYYITCHDEPLKSLPRQTYAVLDLLYDPSRDCFIDPHDVYPLLRQKPLPPARTDAAPLRVQMDAALLVGRYHYELEGEPPQLGTETPPPGSEVFRSFVTDLFTGPYPWKGLELLMRGDFIPRFWPMLVPMDETSQSKGHHPEGNVWVHSLETLKYRKTADLVLSLALFLHDCGKPYSRKNGERRFDGHADIGADLARRFLSQLGFDAQLVDDVYFLVKFHMVPGALSALPIWRTEKLMASPLFPILLELYRCDLSSTYRGPDGYYQACKIYRAYLKHSNNPFRGTDGKKLVRLYVE